MRVIINKGHGFSLVSKKALVRAAEIAKMQCYAYKSTGTSLLVQEYFEKVSMPEGDKKQFEGLYLFTKDFGEKFPIKDDSWKQYELLWTNFGRESEVLMQAIEELGEEANTDNSFPKIVEISDEIKWRIVEDDFGDDDCSSCEIVVVDEENHGLKKIVVNHGPGKFNLSEAAYKELGLEWDGHGCAHFERDDPALVSVIERLGEKAWNGNTFLSVWEVEKNYKICYIEEVYPEYKVLG